LYAGVPDLQGADKPGNVGYYMLMSDIYTDTGQLDGVATVRAMMRQRGLKTEPGCSYIGHKGKVHLFMADDHSHPQAKGIYELVVRLEQMVKEKLGVKESGEHIEKEVA
jgi:hypothetical protein